ncbi:hypothetical protein ES703_33501 [subsurface metagenome]
MQFINLVELILDPARLRPRSTAQPHTCLSCRVKVISIQSRAVDGIFRAHICLLYAGSCGRYVLNRISNWLDREAPDFAFKNCGVGRRVDFIDSPVIGLAEIKQLRWSIAAGILDYTANAVVDIVEVLTEVEFVPIDWGCIFSRRPAKDNISWHIC